MVDKKGKKWKKMEDIMKRNMKKVLSLALIVGLVLLSGCGGRADNKKTGDAKENATVEKSDDKKDDYKKEKLGSKSKKTTIKKKVSDNKKQPTRVNNIKNNQNKTNKPSNLNSGKRKAVKPVMKAPAPRKKHTVVKGKTKWKKKIGEGRYAEGGGEFDWPKDWN